MVGGTAGSLLTHATLTRAATLAGIRMDLLHAVRRRTAIEGMQVVLISDKLDTGEFFKRAFHLGRAEPSFLMEDSSCADVDDEFAIVFIANPIKTEYETGDRNRKSCGNPREHPSGQR